MRNPPVSNIAMIIEVASQLDWLLERVVFVGGSILELMLTEPVQFAIRPTKDVDLITEVSSTIGYAELERELRTHGHSQRAEIGDPICRWLIGETVVDLMPVASNVLGFSNRWYPDAIENWFWVKLTEQLQIRVIIPPYFIATKIEAFLGRGNADFVASHDIEDIIMVLNGRPEIIEEIKACSTELKAYLATQLNRFANAPDFLEAIQWSLPGDTASQARQPLIVERMRAIVKLVD